MIKISLPEENIPDVIKPGIWKFMPEIALNPNRSPRELSSKDVRNSLFRTSFFNLTTLYMNWKDGNYQTAHM